MLDGHCRIGSCDADNVDSHYSCRKLTRHNVGCSSKAFQPAAIHGLIGMPVAVRPSRLHFTDHVEVFPPKQKVYFARLAAPGFSDGLGSFAP